MQNAKCKIKELIFRNFKLEQGSTLIYTLALIAAMTAGAASFGVITINSLRQAKNIDSSIEAYYISETGLEDGLWQVRKKDLDSNKCGVSINCGCLSSLKCTRTISPPSQPLIFSRLPKDQAVGIDLFDSLESLDSPIQKKTNKIAVGWDEVKSGGARLEVTWIKLLNIEEGEQDTFKTLIYPIDVEGNKMRIVNFAEDNLYKIQLKALEGDLLDLQFEALDINDKRVDIQGWMQIQSSGNVARTKQDFRLTAPLKVDVYPLWDYVVFSEESLNK